MRDPKDLRVDPLGRSVKLDDGDLAFSGEPPGGLQTIQGLEALRQALTLALETQLGSDPLNTTFGFDQTAIGSQSYGLRTQKEHLKLQLVRAIGNERRVKDVKEIYFDDDPRFFELNPEVERQEHVRQVRSSRVYRVTMVIETVEGDTLALQVGGARV